MKVRKHLVFYGRVQGVGFRYTLYHYAQQYGITGWVRNRYDGCVEAILQGEDQLIQQIIQNMQTTRYIVIERMEIENLDILEHENSFEVRY